MPTATKRYREFTIIFKDPDLNGFSHPNDYLEFINNSESIKSLLKYLIFQWEIDSENLKTFYQMYFEFKDWMSFKKIQNDYFDNLNVVINPRIETQAEAIKKCSDQSKFLVINEYFELGEPRKVYNKSYSPTNTENKKIPLNHKEAKTLNLDRFEFSQWYQPIFELIPEPDYSLIKD